MQDEVKKIIRLFDILKKILDDKAICDDNRIVIFDPPFEIQILRNEELIVFSCEEDDIAILSEDDIWIKDGFEEYVKDWMIALTSLGFKRFILKDRR